MTIRIAPAITPAFAGSFRSTSAIATEKSGAVPTVTDVRDGPASRTARVKRSCEQPGPSTPASRNGQIPARSISPAATKGSVTSKAAAIVSTAPASASGLPRQREPERDRHRAEERGRCEREHDRVHGSTLQRLRSAAVDDPRVRELAELMVNRCLDVQPGWQVSVRATPFARPLVREVAGAIARRGAYYLPRINWGPERFRADLDWALEAPLELLGELPAIEATRSPTRTPG